MIVNMAEIHAELQVVLAMRPVDRVSDLLRVSSGKFGRSRKFGVPKVNPLVMETCGGKPNGLVKVGVFSRLACS